MVVNYAEAYQQGFIKAYAENGLLYSQKLWNSASNKLIKFDSANAKIIKVPKLTITSGRRDRARATIGQNRFQNNYSNDWTPYELTNERYWETLVDPLDVDESNMVVSIANVTKAYNDQQKVPEMDKQMFSSLYAAIEDRLPENIAEVDLDVTNLLTTFDTFMTSMTEARVPAQGRELYVTPTVNSLLKNIQNVSRSMNVQNNNGTIDRIVTLLDNVVINEVPSDLLKTAYDFTVGAVDAPGSKQIQMMLIHDSAFCAPIKYTFAGVDNPSALTAGNYLYYENSYDDVIVFEGREDAIAFAVEPTP